MNHYTISDYGRAIEQAKTMHVPSRKEIGGLITLSGLVELPNSGNPKREYIPAFPYSQHHLFTPGNRVPHLGIWHTHYLRNIPPSENDILVHLPYVLRCGGEAIMIINPFRIFLIYSGGQEVYYRPAKK